MKKLLMALGLSCVFVSCVVWFTAVTLGIRKNPAQSAPVECPIQVECPEDTNLQAKRCFEMGGTSLTIYSDLSEDSFCMRTAEKIDLYQRSEI